MIDCNLEEFKLIIRALKEGQYREESFSRESSCATGGMLAAERAIEYGKLARKLQHQIGKM